MYKMRLICNRRIDRRGIVPLLVIVYLIQCVVTSPVLHQLHTIQDDVQRIIDYNLKGEGRHQTFDRLARLGDKFGPRQSGSQALEDSLDYIMNEMRNEGFENVHGENVSAPSWVRGEEWARLEAPRVAKLAILGLGTSIGTNGTLTAEAIVFESFEELELNSSKIPGKIVVYNQHWTDYGSSGIYRRIGAARAAKYGARAALVRSLTQLSIYSPHTGVQNYNASIPMIPVASITVEDAEMMWRMQNRGENVTISLFMSAENRPNTISRNVVGEIVGSQFPDQVVIFGGHIDSWDVGTGSVDDGTGVMISWQGLTTIKKLGLTPKRTIRVVLWTADEFGVIGGNAYFQAHKHENGSVSLLMESDAGAFHPRGIGFTGSGAALAIMEDVMRPLAAINATSIRKDSGYSSDTGPWSGIPGLPAVELYSANENYFYYHHTNGDSMSMLNADDLDRCTIVFATVAYSVACLDDLLPRTGDHPVTSTVTSTLTSRATLLVKDTVFNTFATSIIALILSAICNFRNC